MARVVLDRKQVAAVLEEIGTLLELKGENPFKARAYAVAARTLESLNEDLETLINEGRVRQLKGIGEVLAEKITTLATTGRLPYHEELRKEVPAGLLEMIQIPGLGPKRAHALHEKLGLDTVEALAQACREGKLEQLAGFGKKSQETILEGIGFVKKHHGRMLLSEATALARELLATLSGLRGVARCEFAGSLRRRKEVVGDIDLLASVGNGATPADIIKEFAGMPSVEKILGAGDTKASVILSSGRQADLRVVSDDEYPFALHYFTGSAEHNIAIRRRAQSLGLKINEYGLWKGAKRLACKDEEAIFRKLGLPFIPPELREDWGEIDAAEADTLPRLVQRKDLRGTFHVHSTYSDGTDPLEAMIHRAATMGFEYVGISDHSRSAGYAGGLSVERLEEQRGEIAALRKKYAKITILHGIESDILKDGSLDYPRAVLEKFDFVIGSVHSSFTLSEQEQTRRVVKALENPYLTILGHPTGRLLLQRDGFKIDLDRVIEAAARAGKVIEVNASPLRLDLDWRRCRQAKEAGVKVSINPDAHGVDGLQDVDYGVDTARRGWLEAGDVLNTRSWEQIRSLLGAGARTARV